MVLSTGFDLVAYHNLSELVSSCNASDSALDAAWLSDKYNKAAPFAQDGIFRSGNASFLHDCDDVC